MRTIYYWLVSGVLLLAVACNPATPTAPASASKAAFATSGPDVDLLKKVMESFGKGDWAAYRSCFDDSAFSVYNEMATDADIEKMPIDSAVAYHQRDRENLWEGMNINTPIYEVVTDSSGAKYGHIWCKLTSKNRKTGKTVNVTVFSSVGFKNDKLAWEWVIYDTRQLN